MTLWTYTRRRRRHSGRSPLLPAVLALLAVLTVACQVQATETEVRTPSSQSLKDVQLVKSDCDDRDLTPTEDNLAQAERATLCLINAERTARDRTALDNDSELTEAARAKSRDMVEQRYFAHTGPDGRDVRSWVRDTDYLGSGGGWKLGENLAWVSGSSATPEMIVLTWMRSPGHRRNVLTKSFEDSGIGIALGAPRPEGGGGATYTQMFGARPGS